MQARLREHLIVGLGHLTALGLVVWHLRDPRESALRIEPAPTSTPAPSATPVRWHVHVSGAVRRPDVVILPQGARAEDAVRAAGGWAEDADRNAINLAASMADGMQLHVPVMGESPAPPPGARPQAPVVDRQPAGAADAGDPASTTDGAMVDINRASASELESLPGIGPALAARIVAHRAESGPFREPRDLLAVSGIGTKTLERFRDRLTLR